MAIIHGARLVTTHHGRAAEFCVVCRAVRWCQARELRWVSHVWFVPLGEGQLFGSEFRCDTCSTPYRASLDIVRSAPGLATDDLMETAERTSVLGRDGLANRLDVEVRAYEERLTPDERAALLREPIQRLSYLALKMRSRGRGESAMVSLGVGGAFAGAVATVGWYELYAPGRHPVWTIWLTAIATPIALACLGLCIWMMARQRRLAAGWYTVPLIVRALGPLRPTREELERTLADLHEEASIAGIRPAELARRLPESVH